MHKVYLSLGANIGNRKRAMRQAIEKLDELVGSVVRQSELYETKPWGFESPNDFTDLIKDWENGTVSTSEALKRCGFSEATFYRRRKQLMAK